MSKTHDIAAYYDQTEVHYTRWWQLSEGMALHYGLWSSQTHSFLEALSNTNKALAYMASIKPADVILDAGCGVGGSAIFLAKSYGALVKGISLSEKQINTARDNAIKSAVDDLTEFKVQDYTETNYTDESFDVIWACESLSSCTNKDKFAAEAFRLLKPGGRLIIADFFRNTEVQDKQGLLEKWSDSWAMSTLVSTPYLHQIFSKAGFNVQEGKNYTREVSKTVSRLYRGYLLGAIPSRIYNTLFGAREYARAHYKSGYYQYHAYKLGLWNYKLQLYSKPA